MNFRESNKFSILLNFNFSVILVYFQKFLDCRELVCKFIQLYSLLLIISTYSEVSRRCDLIWFCQQMYKSINFFFLQRNWVFATHSVFVKPISLQPYDVNLWYFKLTLFHLSEFIVWNIKVLRHWVATILKLENQSLWQKLNSFSMYYFNWIICYNNE